MGQTFKQAFAGLEPERRAHVVFGMDQLHRKYLAARGGETSLPYDAAEHLTDEATIRAYLAVVRQESGDPHVMLQARVDAARARMRLAEEAKSRAGSASAGGQRGAPEPRRPAPQFRNHVSRSDLQSALGKAGRPLRHPRSWSQPDPRSRIK